MAANKTTYTGKDPLEFINGIDNEKRRTDGLALLALFQSVTGYEAKMYGPSIVGFGNYHYKYASGHEGDAPLAAFSPRKDSLVIYIESEFENREQLLSELGKYKISKACVYIKKLEEIDLKVLNRLISESVAKTIEKYP